MGGRYAVGPDGKKRVPDNKCQNCNDVISKDRLTSWSVYDKRKFCSNACKKAGMAGRVTKLSNEVKFTDGTMLPLGGYITKKTRNFKDIVDFYIGLIKCVLDKPDDAKDAGKYKGFVISNDLVREANRFLLENGYGKPGPRKEEVVVPELSRAEIEARLVALNEEQGVVTIPLPEYRELLKLKKEQKPLVVESDAPFPDMKALLRV